MKVRSAAAAVAVGSKREAVEWAFIFYSRSEKYGHMVDGSKTTTYLERRAKGTHDMRARCEHGASESPAIARRGSVMVVHFVIM